MNNLFIVLGIIILIFIIAILVQAFIIVPFREERSYIKMEMKRSTDRNIYLFWKRQLKRLYLKSIPIIGRFIK